jgi:CRP/FNR family transcriptional regulator
MIKEENKKFIIQTFSFWDKLNKSQQELIINNASLVRYSKGENIHSGESNCIGIIIIIKGAFRTYILSEDGREITLYRLFENEACVLSASCVLENITFDVFIDAVYDSEVLLINSAIFKQLCDENVYVQNFSYQITVERFSDVMWAMQQILFMSFDQRLAIFLLDEMNRNSSDMVNLTHEQIASFVGSAREVVSRMLKYFENEGLIKLYRGKIKILDKKRLSDLIGNNID